MVEAGLGPSEALGRWTKEDKSNNDHYTYPELCTWVELSLATLGCGRHSRRKGSLACHVSAVHQ